MKEYFFVLCCLTFCPSLTFLHDGFRNSNCNCSSPCLENIVICIKTNWVNNETAKVSKHKFSALYFPRVQAGCACRADNCILMSSSGNPSTGWLCITFFYWTSKGRSRHRIKSRSRSGKRY